MITIRSPLARLGAAIQQVIADALAPVNEDLLGKTDIGHLHQAADIPDLDPIATSGLTTLEITSAIGDLGPESLDAAALIDGTVTGAKLASPAEISVSGADAVLGAKTLSDHAPIVRLTRNDGARVYVIQITADGECVIHDATTGVAADRLAIKPTGEIDFKGAQLSNFVGPVRSDTVTAIEVVTELPAEEVAVAGTLYVKVPA